MIGGAQIYEEALKSEKCEAVHLTEVEGEFESRRLHSED